MLVVDRRRRTVDPNTNRIQIPQTPYKPTHSMLTRNIQRRREPRTLSRNTADMHDSFGIGRGDFIFLLSGVQPPRNGQLRRADRMRDIDVQRGVVPESFGCGAAEGIL